MKLKYDNLTISGGIGVGTTTLYNNLKPYLAPLGFKFRSSGEYIREHTRENIMPVATLVSDEFDRSLEESVEKTLKSQKKWVVEAWLSGFVARNFKNALKVLLICSNKSLKTDRIVNRDKLSVSEAQKQIETREKDNFKKWRRIYGHYSFFDPKYYDLVIDTSDSGPLETVGKVLDKLEYKSSK